MTTDYCDMCKGDTRLPIQSMPIGLRCDCGWHFHIGHQLLADATAEVRCPMCQATCPTLEVKPGLPRPQDITPMPASVMNR